MSDEHPVVACADSSEGNFTRPTLWLRDGDQHWRFCYYVREDILRVYGERNDPPGDGYTVFLEEAFTGEALEFFHSWLNETMEDRYARLEKEGEEA